MEANLQFEVDIKKFARGNFYTAKVIDCEEIDEQCKKDIESDIKRMMSINNQTILRVLGYSPIDFHNEKNITIIMEHAPNGPLTDIFKQIQNNNKPSNYTNTACHIILVGISQALKYLHDHDIVHGSVIPSQILLDEEFHPHIAFSPKKSIDHLCTQYNSQKNFPYLAPEFLKEGQYDKKSDIYSFGILMYQIVTDSVPYPDFANGKVTEFELTSKIINENYRPQFNARVGESVRQFIEKCWSPEPNERPSINEIFIWLSKTPLFEGINSQAIEQYLNSICDPVECLENLLETVEKENRQLKESVEKLRNENRKIEEELKLLNEQKEKRQIGNVSKFNSLTLKSQISFIKDIMEQHNGADNQVISFFDTFFLYLSRSYINTNNKGIEIQCDENTNLADLTFKTPILIGHSASEIFLRSNLFELGKFIDLFKKFELIVMELKYLPLFFDDNYQRLLRAMEKINLMDIKRLKISILVDVNYKTDMKFCGNKEISYVKIGSSVVEITGGFNRGSFSNCSNLERIELLNFSLINIGKFAFSDCKSLTELIIPASTTRIGEGFLFGCSNLKKVSMQSKICHIPKFAFRDCTSLVEISIPSVISIGQGAFYGCSSLEHMKIPASVLSINAFAFYRCTSLIDVEIPASVTEIQEHAFDGCSSLKEISIPLSVYRLGDMALNGCKNLMSISIPERLCYGRDLKFANGCIINKI